MKCPTLLAAMLLAIPANAATITLDFSTLPAELGDTFVLNGVTFESTFGDFVYDGTALTTPGQVLTMEFPAGATEAIFSIGSSAGGWLYSVLNNGVTIGVTAGTENITVPNPSRVIINDAYWTAAAPAIRRVAYVTVPEPGAVVLVMFMGAAFGIRGRG